MLILDEIKQITGLESEIKFVFYGGSTLFCNDCADKDLIAVIDNYKGSKHFALKSGYDVFVYTTDEFVKFATLELNDHRDNYSIAIALAKGNNIVYGTNPISNYDWFSYRDKIIQHTIDNIGKYFCNIKIKNTKAVNCCLKRTYWAFANYFALVNNSLDFTEEQLDIIQKCHDNELPRSYAYDLCQKLLEMLPKQEEQEVEQPTISYDELVDSKIRARYTASQEFAILRQRDTKPDEFAEYNAYCEQCKAEAKAELGIE